MNFNCGSFVLPLVSHMPFFLNSSPPPPLPTPCSAKADRVQRGVPAINLDVKPNFLAHVLGQITTRDRVGRVLILDGAGHVAGVACGLEPARHGSGLHG